MLHFLAASSVFHSINNLNRCEKKRCKNLVTAILGLSLNNNSLNQEKNLRLLLKDTPLKEKKVVVWHDAANNSISSHRININRPACKKIVYCRREGTPDLFSHLFGTGAPIIPATKRLFSKSKQNDPEQLKEKLKLHQSVELELKSLRLVVAHKERLSELIGNIRGEQQRTSQTRRKAKAGREQKLQAEEVSALPTGVRRV